MALKEISYQEARPQMKPGDVIAFGGKGHFSEIIKFATRSEVSYVGIILQTKIRGDDTNRFFNQIIESASANGMAIYSFSDRLTEYEGEMWRLPLRTDLWQENFDKKEPRGNK